MNLKELLEEQLAGWSAERAERTMAGDNLAQPRQVDHYIYYRTSREAELAVSKLEAIGFHAHAERRPAEVLVIASREDAMTDEAVKAALIQILPIVLDTAGEYDGSGASIA